MPQRLLAAARAKRDAGALDAALGLLVAVDAGPLDALQTAEVEHLRGQIALEQRRGGDAARLLLSAARRLEPLNADLARETHLEALVAAMWAGDLDTPGGVAGGRRGRPRRATRSRPAACGRRPARRARAAGDRGIRGGRADAQTGTRAGSRSRCRQRRGRPLAWLAGAQAQRRGRGSSCGTPTPGISLAARQAQVARDTGALVHLQSRAQLRSPEPTLLAGELTDGGGRWSKKIA